MFHDEQSQKGITRHVALLHVICETSMHLNQVHEIL